MPISFKIDLKEIKSKIRKKFAPKEQVVKNKKLYSRKNKDWKKDLNG